MKSKRLILPNPVILTENDSLVLQIGESGEVESVSICRTLDLNQFAADTAKIMADNLTYDDGE